MTRLTSLPTLIVAGTASGVGKTTVFCAIAAALSRRGLRVRPFKSGPDYLDPTHHAIAAGVPSRNLDTWLLGEDGVRGAYLRGCVGGDVALIEGAMGLFDGADGASLTGSTADIARLLGTPVILVIDVDAMAGSASAVAEGFARHRAGIRVAAVVANRIGSAGHAAAVRDALSASVGGDGSPIACVGALPVDQRLAVPARHLGLVAAEALPAGDAHRLREAWADAAEAHLDLETLLALARSARAFAGDDDTRSCEPQATIAIARDAAFHFRYEDDLDLLRAAGARIVEFSPLADGKLPDGTDGVIIGGGYPESHAARLAANMAMLDSLRAAAADGRPIYGECGGLMYLGEQLTDLAGKTHAMCGLLPVTTAMTPRLHAFGYRNVEVLHDCLLAARGDRFRGHEFHHARLIEARSSPCLRVTWSRGAGLDGFRAGSVIGAFTHICVATCPAIAQRFVDACVRR